MLCCLFETAAVLTVLAFIVCVVIILRSDADLVTLFWERFGTKPESLAGKVVWVTGASSGIGENIAYQLTQIGCKVIISARREAELNRVKDACLASAKCRTKAEDIMVLPLDVCKCDTHKDAVQTVLDKFKQIDILVNNAGQGQRAKWCEVELSVDRDLFELNVVGTVSLTQCVLPGMMERRQGQIVVVSSIVGFVCAPLSRSYSGAKHAVQGFFGVLRDEMREHNIDVTLICPGPVKSGFNSNTVSSTGEITAGQDDPSAMTSERCAVLSCVAIANRMWESWAAVNPSLTVCYLRQYFPNFQKWFMWRYALGILKKRYNR